MLCDALITRSDYDQELKKLLITKWLLNTATIIFNEGSTNVECILTLQGKQGIDKTRLIRKLIPIYVKTGLELGTNTEFDWDVDKDIWIWKLSTNIANKLHLKSSKGLRANLENYGAIYKKVGNKRGYVTSPYKTLFEYSGY